MTYLKKFPIHLVFLLLLLTSSVNYVRADTTLSPSDFRSPFAPGHTITVSQGPFCSSGISHSKVAAIDFRTGVVNVPVYASLAGQVIYSDYYYEYDENGKKESFGNLVKIKSGEYEILYGHLSGFVSSDKDPIGDRVVQVGQNVEAGQLIGFVGSSGWSTGYHLHFEIRKNGLQELAIAENLPWISWGTNQEDIKDRCKVGVSVQTQPVAQPACQDRYFDGVAWFDNRYCQTEINNRNSEGTSTVLTGISSIYVGSGWSAIVKDARGQWQCVNNNRWDASKDNWHDATPMDNTIVSVQVIHNSVCSLPDVSPYNPDIADVGTGPAVGGSPNTDRIARLFSFTNNEGSVLWAGSLGFTNEPNAYGYSLDFPSGWSVRVWSDDNRNGRDRCFSSRINNLQDHGWQNAIQSVEVFDTNVCPDANNNPYIELCEGDGGENCLGYFVGTYSLPFIKEYDLNDKIRSVGRVPVNMSVMLFKEIGMRGTADCYNDRRVPLPMGSPWDLRGQVTDLIVFSGSNCPSNQLVSVIFYNEQNFSGYHWGMGNVEGFTNIGDIGGIDKQDINDHAESVRIPDGWSVILYEHDGGQGSQSNCLTGNVNNLGSLNNQVSSMRLFKNSTCTVPSPAIPTDLTAQAGTSNILVRWNHNGENTIGYKVYRWDGTDFIEIATVGPNAHGGGDYSDNNLPCETTHFYQISAYGPSGQSPRTNWVMASTFTCPYIPEVLLYEPTNELQVTQGQSITFEWLVPNSMMLSGDYRLRVFKMGTENLIFSSSLLDERTYSYSTLGLEAGWYIWSVEYTPDNGHYFSIPSVRTFNITSENTVVNAPVLSLPFNNKNFKVGEEVVFHWLGDADFYEFHLLQAGNELQVIKLTENSWLNNTLVSGTYQWFIRAFKGDIYTDSLTRQFIINTSNESPIAPSNLQQLATNKTSFTLGWTDNSHNEDGFKIYRWLSETREWILEVTVDRNVNSFTKEAICEWGSYFKITAYNQYGESSATNFYNAHTGPCSADLGQCPQENVAVIAFYEHWKCLGNSWKYNVGEYSVVEADDTFSSVKVAPGYSVRVYAEPNFEGTSKCFNADFHDFFYTGVTFDDAITSLSDEVSSLKISADITCSGTYTTINMIYLPIVER